MVTISGRIAMTARTLTLIVAAVIVIGVLVAASSNWFRPSFSRELLTDAQLTSFRGSGSGEDGVYEDDTKDTWTCYGTDGCTACDDAYLAVPAGCAGTGIDYMGVPLGRVKLVEDLLEGMPDGNIPVTCSVNRPCIAQALQADHACDPCALNQCAPYYFDHNCKACQLGSGGVPDWRRYYFAIDP